MLPGGGLDPAALIEIKPASHADWPAALAFAAGLAIRRRPGRRTHAETKPAPVLWCCTAAFSAEHGVLHGHGLTSLGLAAGDLIAVEAARPTDTLWALEEGLRSRALSVAIGILREVDLTPSRRLSLAAAATGTPALLLTLPESAPAPAAWARLRVGRLASAPHPFDAKAPGTPRFSLLLERCRGVLPSSESRSLELAWCDVSYRFHLAAGLADRAHAPAQPRLRAQG